MFFTHNNNNIVRCQLCPDSYLRDDEESHLRGHDYLMFRCRICAESHPFGVSPVFASLDEATDHAGSSHGGSKQSSLAIIVPPRDARSIRCSGCKVVILARGTRFFDLHKLHDHDDDEDKVTSVLGCRLCDFTTREKDVWENHFAEDNSVCLGSSTMLGDGKKKSEEGEISSSSSSNSTIVIGTDNDEDIPVPPPLPERRKKVRSRSSSSSSSSSSVISSHLSSSSSVRKRRQPTNNNNDNNDDKSQNPRSRSRSPLRYNCVNCKKWFTLTPGEIASHYRDCRRSKSDKKKRKNRNGKDEVEEGELEEDEDEALHGLHTCDICCVRRRGLTALQIHMESSSHFTKVKEILKSSGGGEGAEEEERRRRILLRCPVCCRDLEEKVTSAETYKMHIESLEHLMELHRRMGKDGGKRKGEENLTPEEAFDLARRSVKVFPVDTKYAVENIHHAAVEFLRKKADIPFAVIDRLKIERTRLFPGKNISNYISGKSQSSILITFGSPADRDVVMSFHHRLVQGAKLIIHVPDHLERRFQSLGEKAFKMKKVEPRIKTQIRLCEKTRSLALMVKEPGAENWKTM